MVFSTPAAQAFSFQLLVKEILVAFTQNTTAAHFN